MKKIYITSMIFGLALSASPIFTFAQTASSTNDDNSSTTRGPGLLLRQDIRDRVKENEEARNQLLERGASERDARLQKLASSTQARMEDRQEKLQERASTTQARIEDRKDRIQEHASTTQARIQNLQQMREQRTRDFKEVRLEIFRVKKDNLVKQLNRALENLRQVRERISSRITRAEGSGRDMTDAKAALVIADAKIIDAQTAVDAFAATNATASSSLLGAAAADANASSTIVDLTKPRQVGDAAIKAVKAAKESLHAVVRAIAHSMGLKLDDQNSTTTPPIATSTATTTP